MEDVRSQVWEKKRGGGPNMSVQEEDKKKSDEIQTEDKNKQLGQNWVQGG